MGALILLHGLFLIHCNTQATPVGQLVPQTCEILALQNSMHRYQALGSQPYQTLPDVNYLNAWPIVSGVKNPNQNKLAQRVLVLNQRVDTVISSAATTRIAVPMPDAIVGANAVWPYLNDVLYGTDPSVVSSQATSDGSVRVAETVILSYQNAGAFALTDGANFRVDSKQIGSYNVIALFAWPVSMTTDCSAGFDHPAMNSLIDIGGGAHPTIRFLGLTLTSNSDVDDSDVSNWGLTGNFLRPPCVRPQFQANTAIQTGCAPQVIIN